MSQNGEEKNERQSIKDFQLRRMIKGTIWKELNIFKSKLN